MTSAIDGLISGLDTTNLIKSLMQVEAAPQTALKTKQTNVSKLVTAMQALNTKVAALAESAAKAAKATSWSASTATSSSTAATATAGTTAIAGSVTFSVGGVARSQVSLSAVTPDNGTLVPAVPPAVTVKKADGTYVTVSPATGSLADVAAAINKSADAGVRATVIRVTTGTTAEYRIQFTGTATGEDNAFAVFAGTQAQVQAAEAAADGSLEAMQIDGNVTRTAADASITLWKGSVGLETTITQASNTFTGLMTGVDVTVAAVTAPADDPVTISVTQDTKAVQALASTLVQSLNAALSEVTSRTASTTTTSSDGRTVVTGGLFSGDSGIRNLRERLMSVASQPVDNVSPSWAGITIGRDGTFTFDEAKFTAALAENPTKVQSMVSQLATRVADVADAASNATTGSLTQQITGKQTLVKDYGKQIDGWDLRLDMRRAALEKTYSALEVSLSNLQAQSAWLTSQLASLTTQTSTSGS